MSYRSNNHYQENNNGNSNGDGHNDSYYSTPTLDAMRSNQQPDNYAMQEMPSARQRNAQRDTYGIPYDTNGYIPDYQQQQEQYHHYAANQQQHPQGQYDHDQYYDSYHAAGGNGANNNTGGYYDASEQQQQLQQPKYYNGYERNSMQLLATQQNRSGAGGSSRPSSMQSNSYKSRALKEERPRSKCLPCFPCIRSTCGRVTCCFFLLILLAIIVLVVIVLTVFKIPTVDYLGLQGEPTFAFNQGNTTLAINFVATIQVKNPNPIGFNFEKIAATAYYPGYSPALGGGEITNASFPSKSTKEILFPITASYDRQQDPGFTVVQDILSRCGILGGVDGQLTINYDIKLTLKILGFSVSPGLKNQSANFACPTDIGQITNGLPGGIGQLLGGGKGG
ncbi:hypothetical protein EMPS_05154 [Entomortierella parvispora]|uniref:Late embryogenesis abundant protein LEA-2 subgroup domain-containing protein n=1 Tax=Entomortierella parvispora TaxID=205924 RepID=A0A9P3HA22_9FUNG|nr:hypothetical protein EMPS_05154 [Entomortierella parvispora]